MKAFGLLSVTLLSDDQDPPNRTVTARCDYALMDDEGNWVPSPAGSFVSIGVDDDLAAIQNTMQVQIRVDCDDSSIEVIYI